MEISKQYAERGYAVIKKLLNQDEIEKITIIVDLIYDRWLNENGDALIEHQLINMHSLTHPRYFKNNKSERIKFFELIAPEQLTDLIEKMFGKGINFHNTQLFFNPYTNTKTPYWHRDLQYSLIEDSIQAQEQNNILSLHIRIPLIAEKGIELVPGTHKRWDSELERNVRLELNGHINSEKLPGGILIELEPRDILIFNAQMIHRGNYGLNKVRKALDLCIGKQHHLLSGFLDRDILPNDDEIRCISNNQWYVLAKDIADQNFAKEIEN
ncbi:phytanoyl-CoA dioxygenase family protein [Pleurocapsa sp. PCC 7319]|uniref:phytanoyl-CoA dioxygenase family protein n=1 Tax=Pleurocapsa sp. PCC 7319 TaxID=118161 RepID=UPI000346971C|nr:phytanoyl-CoA dioxygenase family protein [Pleurocapsa sp. PCC 7319]